MRKLFVLLTTGVVVLAFTLPAMAQAQWSFYGSVRMETQYQTVTKEVPTFLSSKQGTAAAAWNAGGSGPQDDSQLVWSQQTNSRIGAIVKNGDITGRFEYGGSTGDYDPSSADPENIRLLYGQWSFSKDGFIEVGRDYTPYNYVVTGLCGPGVAGKSDCLGRYMGTIYGGRRSVLKVGYKGFQFALVDPKEGTTLYKTNTAFPGATHTDPTTSPLSAAIPSTATTHIQETVPRVEASYIANLGPVSFFIGGLYNQYTTQYALTATSAKQDVTVSTWAIGVGGKYAYGPFYFNAEGQFNRNPNNGIGTYAILIPTYYMFNSTTNTGQDADYYSAMGIIGFKMSDMITFEGGYVWQTASVTDPVLAGNPRLSQTSGIWYIQSTISLAKNFYIIPEIGEIDYQDLQVDGYTNRNLGNIFWFGIKWQIDF
jgi:hypothetical protein